MNKIIFSALLIGKIILVSGRPLDTEESIKSLRNLVEKQGKLLDLQAREIKALEEHIQQNECQLNAADVAFYAILTKNTHLSDGSTVSYDQVHLNEGNGYQAGSGTFTASSHGIYQFTMFFNSEGICDSKLGITRSTDITTLCSADGGDHGNGMCSINIELEAGDQVNVRVISGSACLSGDLNGQTGFLGTLLKVL